MWPGILRLVCIKHMLLIPIVVRMQKILISKLQVILVIWAIWNVWDVRVVWVIVWSLPAVHIIKAVLNRLGK